ncbi:uncharacterized protein LOC111340812 isoform X1 [Stylophora pistillata]|uniref:uncharacterized protein LOC111340812 isoform X1 n=1 Tax=Stylophora pistillata TaxID=50429 RepID=UPI000C056224|nr:uncharacterized protein LOC111340812 isoform X1 [Stylophora pistillata]
MWLYILRAQYQYFYTQPISLQLARLFSLFSFFSFCFPAFSHRFQEYIFRAGYREGMESGKEASLQQGFNEGFIFGASVSREWAKLRGVLSALMLFASSNYVQDPHPNITNEITELLAVVCQMEKEALSAQTMQDPILDQMNPQGQCSLKSSETGGASLTHHKVGTMNRTVNEHELLAAFEMLGTQDGITNGIIKDLRSRCKQSKDSEGEGCSQDSVMPEKSFNCNQPLVETSKIKRNDMEHLWTKIVSLADRIGVNKQKTLDLKNI